MGADETPRVFEEQSLTLITAGLSALTIIVCFAVFDAVRQTLTVDRRARLLRLPADHDRTG